MSINSSQPPDEPLLGPSVERSTQANAERNESNHLIPTPPASESSLAAQLANAQQLQHISNQLIHEDDIKLLYDHIVDAATQLMQAEMGSLHVLVPEKNELLLLAWKGLDPQSILLWEWIRPGAHNPITTVLNTGHRMVVPDIETYAFPNNTLDLTLGTASQNRDQFLV